MHAKKQLTSEKTKLKYYRTFYLDNLDKTVKVVGTFPVLNWT